MCDGTTRIAVCQIECHPAVNVGDHDRLSEPVAQSKEGITLHDLARFTLDVSSLQLTCRKRYTEWHRHRIRAVLGWLAHLAPVPDLVVFPECSIPLELLSEVRNFAVKHDAVVFAGTHSLTITRNTTKQYTALGIKKGLLKNWGQSARAGTVVLPIFCGRETFCHLKSVPSVFEQTDVTRESGRATLEAVTLSVRGRSLNVVPLVCVEAIQLHNMPNNYDLAVVCAYNPTLEPFRPFIQHHVNNRIPVVFCNDGAFGYSSLNVKIDSRMGLWWWNEPIDGCLPVGDGILVADVHWRHLAPQVGVADPKPAATLVALSAISGDGEENPENSVAVELGRIAQQTDNVVQAHLLSQCLNDFTPSPIQRVKLLQLKRLAASGGIADEWWQMLGKDCIIQHQPSLRQLEGTLSAQCCEAVEGIVSTDSVDDERAIGKMMKFCRNCRRYISNNVTDARPHSAELATQTTHVLDRESECRTIRAFLDHTTERVLAVSGLEDVGKETLIELALRQTGRRNLAHIPLTSDSTKEFVVEALAKYIDLVRSGSSATTLDILDQPYFRERIPQELVVVISDAHFLMAHHQWRDPETPQLFLSLAQTLEAAKGKLIVVSLFNLDLDVVPAQMVRRLPLGGLQGEHRLVLLDQHLRRTGLNPMDYDIAARQTVVDCLGGHPGAIVLASEYIRKKGIDTVVSDVQGRRGVHAEIVRRILRGFRFTEEQACILSLLSLLRKPIPANTFNDVVNFNAASIVWELVRQNVAERLQNDHIIVSDLVRGFADLPPISPSLEMRFHEAAANAFASLAARGTSHQHLQWAVEARYHGQMCGKPELAPRLGTLVDGILGAAKRLVDNNEYERAKPVVDSLLAARRTAETCELAAIVYARLGLCDEALTLAKEAASLERNRIWILTEVGRLALHVHRDEVAANAIEIAKGLGYDSTYLATLEGKVHLRRGEVEEAITAFQRGVDLADGDQRTPDAWAHFYLGRTFLRMGRTDEAIAVLFRGESLESSRFHPRRNLLVAIRTQLAMAYIFSDDIDTAERYFSVVVKDDPGNPEVARAAIFLQAAKGVEDVAMKALAALDPNKSRDRYERCQILLFRGLFMLNLGFREKASAEFSQAYEADRRNVFVLLKWSYTLVEIARNLTEDGGFEAARYSAEQAKSVAEKVLEFDKDNQEALALLEKISDEFNVQ